MNKTANINAAVILSNISIRISHAIATNNFENVGMVITASIASEDKWLAAALPLLAAFMPARFITADLRLYNAVRKELGFVLY